MVFTKASWMILAVLNYTYIKGPSFFSSLLTTFPTNIHSNTMLFSPILEHLLIPLLPSAAFLTFPLQQKPLKQLSTPDVSISLPRSLLHLH
jgi:hypothetical protein